MIGLLVTLHGQAPVAAAQVEDGVISVIAHIASTEKDGAVLREALLEISGLRATEAGDRHDHWLKEALVPGDEIEVRVAEIESPTPWHDEVVWPDPPADCPTGIEVLRNGVVVGTRRASESNRIAPAVVTWSRGAQTNPTPGEYVHLDIGVNYSTLLAVGDTVVIRMLGG